MIEPLLQAERALASGLLDQAEALFDATIAADPRNAIAIVGLARCRLERGDEAEALRLARRALAFDSENPVAQRLVARLEEVAAYRRGAEPAPPAPQPAPPAPQPSPTVPEPTIPEPSVPEPSVPTVRPAVESVAPARPSALEPPAPRRRSLLGRLLRRR